jgi:hypothetical protein
MFPTRRVSSLWHREAVDMEAIGLATALAVLVSFILVSLVMAQASTASGARQPTIDHALVRRWATSLMNARLMRLDDLRDDSEKAQFEDYGFSFIVEGDFDGDGQKDYAVAGKYDNPRNPDHSSLILIFTQKGGKLVRTYFTPVVNYRIALKLVPKCFQGRDGIAYQFTIGSDHGAILVWDGGRYVSVDRCERSD